MRRILHLLVCSLAMMPVALCAQQVKPTNQEILNAALQDEIGSRQGTCKEYLRTVLRRVGIEIGSGYRASYLAIGVEVSGNDALPGDIIQINSDANPEADSEKNHTAIVQRNNGDGTFDVIDANWSVDRDERVRHRPNWNPYTHAASIGMSVHFYRLGRVDGAAIGQLPNGSVNQKFVDMANEIITAYGLSANDVVAYDNGGSAYVHQWEHFGAMYTVQDVLVANAGLTHERTLFILGHDGHTERVMAVKEGFYWLFMLYDTGIPIGNETWSDDRTNIYQMFSETIARWYPGTRVLKLISRSDNTTVIAEYRDDGFFTTGTGGDDIYTINEPAPDPVIPITNVALVIMPTEPNYRYQLARGQEQMTLNLQLNHAGGNAPFVYRFYAGDALVAQGSDPFCSVTLAPGTHAIRARVEAGIGNTLQSQEQSQQIVVEAAPKSDWGVPFEVAVASIARDGERLYVAGRYVSGPNAGKGYLGRANRSNPTAVESFMFSFSFNEILLQDSYLFAATTSGLMVSRDHGTSWSTVYSNGQAYDIAILPGDKWADWPIKILVGCSRGIDYGNWFPNEPNTLRDVRIIGSFGPYTLDGGRYRTRDYLFIIASGNGISSRRAPWHLAYVENAGSLAGSGGGRAYSIRSEDNMALAALQRNAGDNVYYNSYYGDSWAWEKVRGIPQGDDVVAFAWISGLGWGAITATGNLYCAPGDPTRWQPVPGFKEALGLDLVAGQYAACIYPVGPDMLIATKRGLRVIPMERITRLAAKPAGDEELSTLAPEPALLENYPNPFNSETTIRFQLPEARHVTLRVYAITGSLVATLANEMMPAGIHTVMWGGSRYGNGVYVCVLEAGNHRDIRKLTLLK